MSAFIPRLALVLQAVISAGTFLVAKDATEHLTPGQLAWFRIVCSAVCVTPLYFLSRRPRTLPARRDLLRFALLGFLGVTANQTLFLEGIHLSGAINAALLYSFTPALVLLLAVLFLGEKLSAAKIGGVVLAIAGVLLVLSAKGLAPTKGTLGDALILAAVVAWSAYTLGGKGLLRRHDAFTVIAWTFWFGALSILLATPWALAGLDAGAVPLRAWLGVLYLSLMTSVVSYVLWYWALRSMDASQVAIFGNLQAPFTALLAWAFMGDVPGLAVIGGGTLVLLGVTLVQRPAARRESVESAPPGGVPKR